MVVVRVGWAEVCRSVVGHVATGEFRIAFRACSGVVPRNVEEYADQVAHYSVPAALVLVAPGLAE